MDPTKILLSILEETYIIHKLDQSTNLPEELIECEFYSLSNSQEELSLVCPLLVAKNSVTLSRRRGLGASEVDR